MKNKGFTLVELLAVVTILAILMLIVVLTVNPIISNSEKELLSTQKKNIEEAARVYYLKEGTDDTTCVDVEELISKGYIEGNKVVDPETREEMTGSVSITYASNQYSYQYQEETCN